MKSRSGEAAVFSILLAAILVALHRDAVLDGKLLVPLDIPSPSGSRGRRRSATTGRPTPRLTDQVVLTRGRRSPRHRLVDQGEMTLWNPYQGAGTPLHANTLSAQLYPLMWLHALLPRQAALLVIGFFKGFLAGLFLFLLLRRRGVSPIASGLAGLAFPLSGFLVVWLGHQHTAVASLLPLLLWLVRPGGRSGTPARPVAGRAGPPGSACWPGTWRPRSTSSCCRSRTGRSAASCSPRPLPRPHPPPRTARGRVPARRGAVDDPGHPVRRVHAPLQRLPHPASPALPVSQRVARPGAGGAAARAPVDRGRDRLDLALARAPSTRSESEGGAAAPSSPGCRRSSAQRVATTLAFRARAARRHGAAGPPRPSWQSAARPRQRDVRRVSALRRDELRLRVGERAPPGDGRHGAAAPRRPRGPLLGRGPARQPGGGVRVAGLRAHRVEDADLRRGEEQATPSLRVDRDPGPRRQGSRRAGRCRKAR